ncbi:Probable poly(glycerol-phosphate) alpha-glucosyltransferase [Fusobacterium necrogenes]|uniref:Probable poly(Glycerol-phosphate) alpha-glucosyltransferase n=1 Tax=Fusobacterium necrogenes TaxID=858 RepID=A0A377GY88_9FUSO|nr:glycosyltransferase [Fusobacterium necrogenes]STO31823.1 Probable poly(glycerol-phosphate) alpha-glucosyltransferase [Fusobacterium necrogenes]
MENIKKKKILFYNGSLRMGGIERVLIEVIQNLDSNKYEIDLIIEDGIRSLNVFEKDIPDYIKLFYLKPENIMQKTIFFREKRKSNLVYRVIYQLMMEYEKYLKKQNLSKIVKNKKYDTIIDFDMGLSKYIDLVNGNKKIVWIHSNIESWYKKRLRIKRLGERLKKYDAVVTICDAMKKNTEELYPFLKNKLIRVYNPFNFQKIRKLAEETDKNNEELLKENYFVSIMRLTIAQKDFETLIRGFSLAKNRGLKEKLYILGDGPDREKISEMIVKEKMEEEIFLLGNIKNPYPWIKNSKGLVHSSKFEGFGLVLVEALILGKTVISSDCPTGPSEILEEGRLGKLYSIGDYDKLSKLLLESLENEKIINKEEIKKYSIDYIIKEYENLI